MESISTFSSIACFSFSFFYCQWIIKTNHIRESMCSVRVLDSSKNCMTMIHESRVVRKGQAIIRDVSHPLFSIHGLLASGRRYRVPSPWTNKVTDHLYLPVLHCWTNWNRNNWTSVCEHAPWWYAVYRSVIMLRCSAVGGTVVIFVSIYPSTWKKNNH